VIPLVARLIMRAISVVMQKRGAVPIGVGLAVADVINLDMLRRDALNLAPGSDPEAIEEAARTAARLLGLEGDEVLWPVTRQGTPIVPHYLTVDLTKGRAWYSSRHYSKKSVNSAFRRGRGRGFGRGRATFAREVTAARA